MSDSSVMDPKEYQALQHYLNEYGQQIEFLGQQFQILEQGRFEAQASIETISGLSPAAETSVLLQIGSGVSVRAKILDPDKILIAIGADVVIEKTGADAIDYLNERITEMEASAKNVAGSIEKIRIQMNEISKRLEEVDANNPSGT